MKLWLYCLLVIGVTACNPPKQEGEKPLVTAAEVAKQPPGTVIAADSIAILPQDYTDLKLVAGSGKPTFIVRVRTTEHMHKGAYSIDAIWGTNANEMQFSMPRGAEDAIPILRRDTQPYSYIIGFYYGNDTTFYDYYSIVGGKNGLGAKYVKAYLFQ
jgi:hypothetical protein